MQLPSNIHEVITRLNEILNWSLTQPSRVGYFTALYRNVTVAVKNAIQQGDYFQDNARMEKLDVVFAGRFIEAFEIWQQGGKPTHAWQLAFTTSAESSPLIVQQMLLGINAHINLDLGIAAATVAPGGDILNLKEDFIRINALLAGMVGDVMHDIDALSPRIAWLDRVAGRTDKAIINFSIKIARQYAWALAKKLAPLPQAQWPAPVSERDGEAVRIGNKIVSPGLIIGLAVWWISRKEEKDVQKIIKVLEGSSARIQETRKLWDTLRPEFN